MSLATRVMHCASPAFRTTMTGYSVISEMHGYFEGGGGLHPGPAEQGPLSSAVQVVPFFAIVQDAGLDGDAESAGAGLEAEAEGVALGTTSGL